MRINRYKILRARRMLPVPGIWNGISQTHPDTKKIHGANLKHLWTHWKKGEYTQINVAKELRNAGELISSRIRNSNAYLAFVYKKQRALGKKLVAISKAILKKDLKSVSDSRLLTLYQEIQTLWFEFDHFNVPPWLFGGDLLQEYIYDQVKKIHPHITEKQLLVLLSPPQKSFSLEEEWDTLKLALKLKLKSLMSPSREDLCVLVNKYYWVPFGYDGPVTYDLAYYAKVIKKLLSFGIKNLREKIKNLANYERVLKRKQEIILKQFPVSFPFLKLIKRMQTLSVMTDERKNFTFQAHVAFAKVLHEIASRLKIPELALKFVTFEELKKFFKQPEKIAEIASRRKASVVIYAATAGKTQVIEGKEAIKLEKKLIFSHDNVSIIRGTIASQGRRSRLKGKVRVILSPQGSHRLRQGEILVATMTSPEYVPAMRKSVAIITDEGGVTSHAAIVSRELGIPCIIGTKTATKVFKDGDLVEVDAEKGIVKLVKRAK